MSGRDRMPLITLYLTERCNSRCVTCDYWRHGRKDVTLESVTRLLPELAALGTRTALISGGEPLLHPEWPAIAEALRSRGIDLWLLTSGLSLAKHATRAASLFRSITVSLDGTCAETYAAIRGLDAFDKVCEGIRAAVAAQVSVGLRVTLQRANYRELPRFVTLARELGVAQISFLAVDVSNPHAFAREEAFSQELALRESDLPELDALLDALVRDHAEDFRTRFIAESPAKLRRLRDYFAALRGKGAFPAVQCNAPEFSAVVGVDGGVSPCFFIPGPPSPGTRSDLAAVLASDAMHELRGAIRDGERPRMRALRVFDVARSFRARIVHAQAPRMNATLEAYERWAPTYPPEPHNPLMRAEQREVLTQLPVLAGRRVLDLACGTGRYAALAAGAVRPTLWPPIFPPRCSDASRAHCACARTSRSCPSHRKVSIASFPVSHSVTRRISRCVSRRSPACCAPAARWSIPTFTTMRGGPA